MTKVSVMLLVVASIAGASFADAYSTGFEYADQASMIAGLQAEGWTWIEPTWDPNLETETVHGGDSAVRLSPRILMQRPLNEFGTLTLWVYDFGLIPAEDNAYGPRWGISKGGEVLAGFLMRRTWFGSDKEYAVNNGWDVLENPFNDQWSSATWMDAGDPAVPDDRSRGVAGWMQWQISYYSDGLIEINLLEDPNFPGFPKAHGSNTVGVPVAPAGASIEFGNPGTGGAEAIYIRGNHDAEAPIPFGPSLIVDDLVWTPEAAAACIPGDADCDGDVDLDDFGALKNNFGAGTTWAQGDFDEDGDVDLDDFAILKNNFGATSN